MPPDAYHRARKPLAARLRFMVLARVLGIVHSLLVLSLLVTGGLVVALLDTQGAARYPTGWTIGGEDAPTWLTSRQTGEDESYRYFENTGLFPLVATNTFSPHHPWHRLGAQTLYGAMRAFPTLRNNIGALATLLALGLSLTTLLCLLAQFRRSLLAAAVTNLATSFRRQIHRQMYRLGHSALPTEGTGPVVNLFTREVNDIRDGLFAELEKSWQMPVLIVGLIVMALFLSWIQTIFLASLGALVWLASRAMHRDARRVSDAAVRDASVQICLLHEDLGLLRTVRVHAMENVDKQRFDDHLERYREADQRRIKTEGVLNPTIGILYAVSAFLAIGLLGANVLLHQRISPSSALVLVLALGGLLYPCLEWIRMRRAIRQANRSAEGVLEFLERRPELHQTGGAKFLQPVQDRISFENVTLESRSGRVLLDGVSAQFPAGSKTAIMSPDEDAKHALVCLIARLIDPKVGRVRVDGNDLREVTLESIRAQVAMILQADLVFTDSVVMNIGLGDSRLVMPRIIEAAKIAHAHNFIQNLPNGYDTVIGSLGHYLTTDEQFRIALARAYLHDPSILIVEEPNVPLDEDTRHLIDDTIARLAQDRTLIILPHRLSTIRSCEQIILLQNGRVEAIGPPRQLQSESKLYRHLQYVEFNQFATGEIEAGQMSA